MGTEGQRRGALIAAGLALPFSAVRMYYLVLELAGEDRSFESLGESLTKAAILILATSLAFLLLGLCLILHWRAGVRRRKETSAESRAEGHDGGGQDGRRWRWVVLMAGAGFVAQVMSLIARGFFVRIAADLLPWVIGPRVYTIYGLDYRMVMGEEITVWTVSMVFIVVCLVLHAHVLTLSGRGQRRQAADVVA
jgi:hypothetical protein